LFHGHLNAHCLFELFLLQVLYLLELSCICSRSSSCQQGLGGGNFASQVFIVVLFEFSIAAIPHHEQISLQFLLLSRVQVAILQIAVKTVIFIFSVLIFILTEACLSLRLRSLQSITKWLIRERLLACIHKHLVMLSCEYLILRGDSLTVELV